MTRCGTIGNVEVLPSSAMFNLADYRHSNAKFSSKVSRSFAAERASFYLRRLVLGEFCGAAFFAFLAKTRHVGVAYIIGVGKVFKIAGIVVELVAINMVYRIPGRSLTNEGIGNQRMNIDDIALVAKPKVDDEVTNLCDGSFFQFERVCAPYVSLVAYFVRSVLRCNLFPDFHEHLKTVIWVLMVANPLHCEQTFARHSVA